MIGIIKKDIVMSLLFVLLIFVLEFVYGYAAWDMVQKYASSSLLLVCNTIFVVLFSHFILTEQAEAKSNGYGFVKTLPLRTGEIVAGKFVLVLFIAVLYVFFTVFVVGLFAKPPEFITFWHAYIVFCAVLSMNITAVLYIALYKFGFSNFFKILVQFLGPVCLVVTFIFWFSFRDVLKQKYYTLILSLFNYTNIFIFVFFGLILFICLMILSIQVYNRNKF